MTDEQMFQHVRDAVAKLRPNEIGDALIETWRDSEAVEWVQIRWTARDGAQRSRSERFDVALEAGDLATWIVRQLAVSEAAA